MNRVTDFLPVVRDNSTSQGKLSHKNGLLESPFCVGTNRTEHVLLKPRYVSHPESSSPHPAKIFG